MSPWYSPDDLLFLPTKNVTVLTLHVFQNRPPNPLQNYYPLKSIPLHPSRSLLPKAPSSDMPAVHP